MTRPHRPRLPYVEVEEVGAVTIAHLRERRLVEDQLVQALGRELLALLGQRADTTLLLDFGPVEHLSSMIIATLMKLQKKARADGGRLALCALRPEVAEVLALTGVDRVLKVFPTEQQALVAL